MPYYRQAKFQLRGCMLQFSCKALHLRLIMGHKKLIRFEAIKGFPNVLQYPERHAG